MTQAEIADVLEEHYPRYLLVQEIITITGLTRVKVYRNMRSLKKRDEVEIKIVFKSKGKGLQVQSYRIKPKV